MKKIHYGFAAILFMLGVACRKVPDVSCNSPTNDAALSNKIIIGKWEWVYEKIAAPGYIDIITKKVKGFSQQLEFCDDKYFLFKDGLLQKEGTFRISSRKEFAGPIDSLLNVLVLEKRDKKIERVFDFKICSDSLYLLVSNDSFEAWSIK
jgi:hypothetical protein